MARLRWRFTLRHGLSSDCAPPSSDCAPPLPNRLLPQDSPIHRRAACAWHVLRANRAAGFRRVQVSRQQAVACGTCQSRAYGANGTRAHTHAHICKMCVFVYAHVVAGCTDCSPGKYTSSPGKYECTDCAAGRYSGVMASVCGTCQQGTYSGSQSSACTDCPPGTYNDQLQQSSCALCAQNTYMDYLGKTACYDCPVQSATLGTGSLLSIYLHMYTCIHTLRV